VRSLARHLQDREVLNVFTSHDVFVLTETRLKDECVFIDGFDCIHAPHHTKTTNKPTATTGGMLVGVKSYIYHAVLDFRAINDLIGGSAVYLCLDGRKVGLTCVLHIVCVYMPHLQSGYRAQR